MSTAAQDSYPQLLTREPDDPINGPLIWATIKYLMWLVATKLIQGMLYFYLVSEGLRRLVPPLAQKIRNLPGLSWFGDYEATHKLDLAHFFALGLLLVTFLLWGSVLRLWMRSERTSIWENQIVAISAIIIITADAVLFYFSIVQFSWGGSQFSLLAILMTAMYVAFLMYGAYVSLKLKENIRKAKRS